MNDKWNLKTNVYNSEFTVNESIDSLNVFDRLQQIYPNDENIATSIEILRNEICKMFGGTIFNDDIS